MTVEAYRKLADTAGTRICGTKKGTVALLKADAKRVEIEKIFDGQSCG
jgi:hypothetical protein